MEYGLDLLMNMFKGSIKPALQEIAIDIFNVCVKMHIDLSLKWVLRNHNEAADHLSKIRDIDDWEINENMFTYLNMIQGPFTLDAFASNISKKVDKFYSRYWCTGSSGVVAFAFDWK
jgi:hypothetical protein